MENTGSASDAEVSAIYSSVKSAIWVAVSDAPARELLWALYEQAIQVMGENDTRWLIALGASDFAPDCTCPDYEAPYTGIVKWTGVTLAVQNPTWLKNVTTENNGKRLVIQWDAPSGDWKEDQQLKFGILISTPITSVTIRLSPRVGVECPTDQWQAEGCDTLSPQLWRWPRFGSAWAHVTTAGAGYVDTVITANTPPASDSDVEMYFRKCPSLGGGAKSYTVVYEIIAINGTPV
jgi:hypothetical protein